MKVIRILLSTIISIVFLSGCVNEGEISKSTEINIPYVNDYTFLNVQGVEEGGIASNSTSKIINDDKKIKEFISKINKMEVIKPPSKELTEKVKELNLIGNYIFTLSDKETMDNKVYSMNFFKDGSIQFQHPDKKEIVYLSKEKHPELLKELKELLELTY
ncbi:hypothetical protein KHA94_09265 [Bacillus sp. FJAT-49705]|uniref:Lipoprotein n=1 Tax=Cytobacillus citreus TaxID=2833586 RepID=A0ABS5NRE4_9BACI|nr:hypothetical protein [Cytobacillus citreus]MBS4190387.1 hypothetical protein [Cytobacillus citreus]